MPASKGAKSSAGIQRPGFSSTRIRVSRLTASDKSRSCKRRRQPDGESDKLSLPGRANFTTSCWKGGCVRYDATPVDHPVRGGQTGFSGGTWRSLVAHLHGVQGVPSSNLGVPTNFKTNQN